jgi:hypothetical protein
MKGFVLKIVANGPRDVGLHHHCDQAFLLKPPSNRAHEVGAVFIVDYENPLCGRL